MKSHLIWTYNINTKLSHEAIAWFYCTTNFFPCNWILFALTCWTNHDMLFLAYTISLTQPHNKQCINKHGITQNFSSSSRQKFNMFGLEPCVSSVLHSKNGRVHASLLFLSRCAPFYSHWYAAKFNYIEPLLNTVRRFTWMDRSWLRRLKGGKGRGSSAVFDMIQANISQ